jgi:adenylate cyclase
MINLASRLEGLNKNYGTKVLVSSAVRAEPTSIFRSVDIISPKGFAEAIQVSELLGQRAEASGAESTMRRRWDEVFSFIAAVTGDGGCSAT